MIMGGLLNIVGIQMITMGMLAKAYAHLSGLREDPVIAWLYRWFTFERSIFCIMPLILVGLLRHAARDRAVGRERLRRPERGASAVLRLLCLVNGVPVRGRRLPVQHHGAAAPHRPDAGALAEDRDRRP